MIMAFLQTAWAYRYSALRIRNRKCTKNCRLVSQLAPVKEQYKRICSGETTPTSVISKYLSIIMAYRPYFQHGIEQLEELFSKSKSELKTLKVLQYELGHRDRPKARALKQQVDELVWKLSAGQTVQIAPPRSPTYESPAKPVHEPAQVAPRPDRVVVECAYCNTLNFVSTLEGAEQHLSCSACRKPYIAVYKYGVMRTTFAPIQNSGDSSSSALKWVIAGIVLLIILALVIK